MTGYVWRAPARIDRAAAVEAERRLAELEQQNAKLTDRMKRFEALANQWAAEKKAAQARVRQLECEATTRKAILHTMSVGYSAATATNRDRVRGLLGTLRAERAELAAERSRRTHAEAALSRSEQRTDSVRAELADERRAHQVTRAELTQARAELATTPAAPSVLPLERRITDLEGALADSQQMRDDAVEQRDEAVALAMGMQVAMDQAHTTLTAALPQMWEIRRRAHQIEGPAQPNRKAS